MTLRQTAVVLALAATLPACLSTRSSGGAKDDGSTPRLSPSAPAASANTQHHRKPADQRRVYRLEFSVASIDPRKPTSTSAHTMNLEESMTGEIRVGSNVPLTGHGGGAGVARQDVGLLIRGTFTPVGDDLLLENSFEMSSVDEGAAVRKIAMRGDAVVTPGKPALVGSAEDPMTHRRMEVTVVATKLR